MFDLISLVNVLPILPSQHSSAPYARNPQSRKSADIGDLNTSNIKLAVVDGCLAVNVNHIHYYHIHFV